MSSCAVPNWHLRQHKQDLNQTEETNKSSHLNLATNHHHYNQHQHQHQHSQTFSQSNCEVAELTWENGHLALHELGGIFPPPTSTTSSQPRPTWTGPCPSPGPGPTRGYDTLESIVHQATYFNPHHGPNQLIPRVHNLENVSSVAASSGGKWAENSGPFQTPAFPPPSGLMKKRTRSENDHESACASATAGFYKDTNDTTLMTWASLESPRSCTRTKTTNDEDSACHEGSDNQEEERDTKGETGPSHTPRKGRAAAVHNQSERRRRDRINQKMKALQKLVPNASKTDKASMLDEVIEYLKQLQAQVQMMSSARFMPQFMMPFGIQQHLQQMSLLTRMGMGMGIGMLDTTTNCQTQTPSSQISQLIHPNQAVNASSGFVPPAFVAPQMISAATQQTNLDTVAGTSGALQDPYGTLLAQSLNLDLYNRMAALQRQQQTQPQQTSNQMQSNNQIQGD